MIETIQQSVMRVCLWGLAASLVVLALRSELIRDAFVRMTLLWRGMTAFGRVAVCSFLLAGILVGGDKTNNVPQNMNSPLAQMQQVGSFFQTGFTGLSGLLPHAPLSINLVNPVQTTEDDIARGYRVASVTTNENFSHAVPSNAIVVGNWHKRGTFGEWMRLDLGDFMFPLGTNGMAYSVFSVFSDGKIRPTPRDAVCEICAVGVSMLAMQGASRFWTAEGVEGSKLLTWENFFLNADTNASVNAQIELFDTGNFVVRSNNVEATYQRINPHDWDDDGIANDIDPNPFFCDGDFFGLANELPECANTNCYYWLDLSVTGRLGVAWISVVCDGTSSLGDHQIVARTNQVCHIPLLAGATYDVQSDVPICFSGVSSEYAQIDTNSATHLTVSLPLEFSVDQIHVGDEGNAAHYGVSSFPINVFPSILSCSGGCCSFQVVDGALCWACSSTCTCGGVDHGLETTVLWEGYSKSFFGYAECGCGEDTSNPTPQEGPYVASVLVDFSKDAVIFEDAYENRPGEWAPRRSTATTLTIHANGGPNGGVLSVSATNLSKLQKNSGPAFPVQPVAVPANHSITYEMNYVGLSASEASDDVVVTATLTENGSGDASTNECAMTVVRLELAAVYEAPENPCTNRHVYGVGEKVNCMHEPIASLVEWSCDKMAGYGNRFVATSGMTSQCDGEFELAYFSELSPAMTVTCGGATYRTELVILEPHAIFVPESRLAYQPLTLPGEAGGMEMDLWQYVRPNYVSFRGIDLSEVPCTNAVPPSGYFANPSNVTYLVHSVEAGAGIWNHVKTNNYWTVDSVHIGKKLPPWSSGVLTWKIPIGWRPALSGSETSWPTGVGPIEDFRFGRAIIGDTEDVYHQVFVMGDDGTTSISKFGWIVIRGTNGVVRIERNQ